MRVTNKMIVDVTTNNLLRNTERLLELQVSMSSGKRINKPSDDPIGMGKVLDYRTDLSSIDQYERNIDQGKSWLNQTESVLDEVYNILTKAQGVAITQASSTADQATRAASAEEIGNIYDHMLHLANTKSGNSYIFSGYKTLTAAFYSDGTYNGDTNEISVATGQNTTSKISLTGQDAFSTTDIFGVLDQLKTDLEANDQTGISDRISELNSSMDHIIAKTAEVGSRTNKMETTENIFINLKLNIQKMLSDTEEIDMAQAVMDLNSQQNIYQASLLSSAKIMDMSLVNFLG